MKVKHTNTSLQRLHLHEQHPSPYHVATQVTQVTQMNPNKTYYTNTNNAINNANNRGNHASMQYRTAMQRDKQYYQQKQRLENDALKKTVGEYKVQQYLSHTSKSSIWNEKDIHGVGGDMGSNSSDIASDSGDMGLDGGCDGNDISHGGTHFDWKRAAGLTNHESNEVYRGNSANGGSLGNSANGGNTKSKTKTKKYDNKYRANSYNNNNNSCYTPDEDVVVSIADSFLNGPIARDILNTKERGNSGVRGSNSGSGGRYGGGTMDINHMDEYLQQSDGDGNEDSNPDFGTDPDDGAGKAGKSEIDRELRNHMAGSRNEYYISRNEMKNKNYPALSHTLHTSNTTDVIDTDINTMRTIYDRTNEQQGEMDLNDILYGSIKTNPANPSNTGGTGGSINPGGSKWKTTKGGWVADFGPLHTHSLLPFPTGSSSTSSTNTGTTGVQARQYKSQSDSGSVPNTDIEVENVVLEDHENHRGYMDYSEVAKTYRDTGVKPWKQHAIMKKHYGNDTNIVNKAKGKTKEVTISVPNTPNTPYSNMKSNQSDGYSDQGSSFFSNSNSSSSSNSTNLIDMEIVRSDQYNLDDNDGNGYDGTSNHSNSNGSVSGSVSVSSQELSTLDINRNLIIKHKSKPASTSNTKYTNQDNHNGTGMHIDSESSSESDSGLSSAPSDFNLDDIKLPKHMD